MKIIMLKKSFFTIALTFVLTIVLTFLLATKYAQKTDNIVLEEAPSQQEICDDTPYTKRELLLQERYRQKKLIALTFDDGPSKYTKLLLEELQKRDVHVTFFILGENATKRKEILTLEHQLGHEIGIHSYVHKLFTRLKDDEILEQIDKTKNIIYEATDTEALLIRVPYGSVNTRVESLLEKTQLTSILWNVDSKDWKFRNKQKIYQYLLKKVKGNDIILMHDTYKTSVDAALELIDTMQNKCYEFVTITEFLQTKEICEKGT